MRARRRRAREVAIGALAVWALVVAAAFVSGDSGPARRAAYPNELPDGPGREIAERACLLCHSAMLVTQQAKDSTGWEKTLAQMTKWGAPMTPAERETLRLYLGQHFGTRAPRPASR